MQTILCLIYYIFLLIPKSTSILHKQNTEYQRVAFIFAGSPRSFIYPAIHESIRFNLINSFCPPESCIPDIFAKVSLADNTHEAGGAGLKDSKGVPISANSSELPLIEHALYRLQYRGTGSIAGSLEVKYMDVGSSAELSEMESSFSSDRHKVFRTLDPRRYSMYFGRWSAYSMARQFETSNNISYSWFVHTRFDMAFGAPVKPCHLWSPAKVWVTDLWPADVPDTFALLAPNHAEIYFSMDYLLADRAMCLGGPNFDTKTLELQQLQSLKLSENQISIAIQAKCKDLTDGWSERILERKLDLQGINRKYQTLGFGSFYMVVVRKTFKHFCDYLSASRQIGWIYKKQQVNSGYFSSCAFMMSDFGREYLPKLCSPIFQYDEYLSQSQCVLSKQVTDWNYLPFRIRIPSKRSNTNIENNCLTVNSSRLTIQPCIKSEWYPFFNRNPEINLTYSMSQLFYFHPLDSRDQMIRYKSYNRDESCLTVLNRGSYQQEAEVAIRTCPLPPHNSQVTSSDFFRVDIKNRYKRYNKYKESKNIFAPILRSRELASIMHGELCLNSSNDSLSLSPCPARKLRGHKSFVFLIERTDVVYPQ